MRNGLVWATFFWLISGSVALAQDARPTTLPGALPDAVVAPQPDPKKEPLPPEVIVPAVTADARPLRFWVNSESLVWWTKNAPMIPVLTTSNSFTDLPPAALGQPGTSIILGDRPISYGVSPGFRISAGFEVANGFSIEGSYLFLFRRSFSLTAMSDGAGNPLLANPYFNTTLGIQDSLGNSNPDPAVGPWAGGTVANSSLRMHGWEINFSTPASQRGDWSFTGYLGFRSIDLHETLDLFNAYTPLISGVLTFLGAPEPAGSIITDVDRFQTSNAFYGGQIGSRVSWQRGAFGIDIINKLAMGVNQQIVNLDGYSTLTPPGGGPAAFVPGGSYNQITNIGHHYRSTFAYIPELGVTFHWRITDRLRASVGYNLIYISRVVRPGDHINPNVDQTLIPTHQDFGVTAPNGTPTFSFRESSFWAQGLTFGMEFRY